MTDTEAKLEFLIAENAALRKEVAYAITLLEEIKSKGVRATRTTTSTSSTPMATGPVFPHANYHRWATNLYSNNPEDLHKYIFADDNTVEGKKVNDGIRKTLEDFQNTDEGYKKAKTDKTRRHKTFQKLWKILPPPKKDELKAAFEEIKAEFARKSQQPAIPETADTPAPTTATAGAPTPTAIATTPPPTIEASALTQTAGQATVTKRRIRRRGR